MIPRPLRDDRGAAGLLVLALAAVLLVVGAGVAAAGVAATARHRAESTADLAALAAAERAVDGPLSACRAAGRVARASAGRVVGCRLVDAVADVVVELPLPGILRRFGVAAARARAGPDDRLLRGGYR